jgi:CheY-like chemotaxis protein
MGQAISMGKSMRRVLIVEDTPADVRQSTAVVKKLGASDVITFNNIAAAMLFLQDVLEGTKPAPDLILLDLSFPRESGFEVLRYWKSTPKLHQIHVVVWTVPVFWGRACGTQVGRPKRTGSSSEELCAGP